MFYSQRTPFIKCLTMLLSSFLLIVFMSSNALPEEPKKTVMVITVNGVINPVSAEFIEKSILKANEKKCEALVIELDTPGGLDASMRTIVKDIIGSEVPVVVFVSPSGSRAASAGVFLTLAAHVAAMAPGTNIGAAHPVGVGEKMDKTVAEKATNDAAAYIKSLAERREKNAQWAEDAVRKSISATESEALQLRVIDLVTKDIATLLSDLDGRKIQTAYGERILSTKNAFAAREAMGVRSKILDMISDPNVAYILMLLGFYGLFFELTNPGTLFPGVIGGICLILAFYAFQTLPVNYAGLLLIILAVILFVLEVKIISHGVLAIGGVISMTIGSLMLFDSPAPFMKLSLALVIPVVLVTAVLFTMTLSLALKAYKRKPVTGREGLIGATGMADTDITIHGGMVSVQGERWSAYSDTLIAKGDTVIVEDVIGLKVKVRIL